MDDLLQSALDIAIDSVTTEVVETAIEETIATTVEMSGEDAAWAAVDVLVDTGAGDALIALAGGPVALVVGYKIFKKWRASVKSQQKA